MRLTFFTGLLLLMQICNAQNEVQYLPNHQGNWKNNLVVQERFAPYKISAEEKRLLLQKAENAIQLIKSFPGFTTPQGMEMGGTIRMKYIDDDEKAKLRQSTPLPLELSISLADYFKTGSKIMVSANGALHTHINLFFNNPQSAFHNYELFYGGLYDQHGNQLYFEPDVVKTYEKAILYSNHRMLFTQSGKKLWVPVTAKQYLEAQLHYHDQKIKGGSKDLQVVYENIKKELGELRAEDQNKPAFYNNEMAANLSRLSLEKTGNTTAIVKLDTGYFDRQKPRAAMQLLVAELEFAGYDYAEPILKIDERYNNNQLQLYNFFSRFDFSKFQTLLD